MVDDSDLDRLRELPAPPVDADAKARALAAAMNAFRDTEIEKKSAAPQGVAFRPRLISRAITLWSEIMSNRRYVVAQALVVILALPVAGYVSWTILKESSRSQTATDHHVQSEMISKPMPDRVAQLSTPPVSSQPTPPSESAPSSSSPISTINQASASSSQESPPPPAAAAPTLTKEPVAAVPYLSEAQNLPPVVAAPTDGNMNGSAGAQNRFTNGYGWRSREDISGTEYAGSPPPRLAAAPTQAAPAVAWSRMEKRQVAGMLNPDAQQLTSPSDRYEAPARLADTSRIKSFASNPIEVTKENPVSTFSADVDTASYSYVRRLLKGAAMPQPDTVRVEEMINYFPYDWQGPENDKAPFKSTVSIMPTPWNAGTKLMHVAIKGYDVKPAETPRANLVFLIDVSGSMSPPDRLPLLKTAFRMLVGTLSPDDTVAIVTYAGTTSIALPPTKASNKAKILNALEKLQAGGSTAGAAGIREAYRLAQESFVKGGINRVMLATDGDFNVGQTSDAELKQLIETERKSGVFLSVLGVGQDNLNDRMMQELAQHGNGTAAYIDTLAEAEKVLVQEASSTIFPIAKDVKIQVEFNPATVSEYRLIGYETRSLKREDFNNDRVDAGEIGSGHAVTAIYEITPKGSPAQVVDDLRYGTPQSAPTGKDDEKNDEYAFVKIRYKAPDGDTSSLITTPVTRANELASFDAASTDQRFSVAVAAFAQKLRRADELTSFGYDKIIDIANGAKGADPFGYRAEFVSLARLAAAIGK